MKDMYDNLVSYSSSILIRLFLFSNLIFNKEKVFLKINERFLGFLVKMRDIEKYTIIYFLYLNLFDNTYVRREDELRLISQKQEFILL